MTSDDIEYYRTRQREELLAADTSDDDYCRTVHLDLARLYGMRVTELEASAARDDGGDAFVDPAVQPIIS